MKKYYRHGDVCFHEVESIKGEKVKHKGKYVVALGEATGHSHTLLCKAMEIRNDGGRNQIYLEQEAELVHQQHKPLKMMKGRYVQIQEREIDHFSGAVRKVVD